MKKMKREKGMCFRFHSTVQELLRRESLKQGKTMTRLMEEAIAAKFLTKTYSHR